MSDTIRLSAVALECPDAGKLAAFYAEITGGKITFLAGHPFCLSTWDEVPS
jgi:hypothetical protein